MKFQDHLFASQLPDERSSQESAALASFMNELLHNADSCYLVVTDNAKTPIVSQTPKIESITRSCSHVSLSRWADGLNLKQDRQHDHRWASLNNDNPSCAGLTCPARAVPLDKSPNALKIIRKGRANCDEESLPTLSPVSNSEDTPFPGEKPKSVPGSFSISRLKTGLGDRTFTV